MRQVPHFLGNSSVGRPSHSWLGTRKARQLLKKGTVGKWGNGLGVEGAGAQAYSTGDRKIFNPQCCVFP